MVIKKLKPMTPSTRILFDHVFGWVLWLAYWVGVCGIVVLLVSVARNREAKIEE